MNPCELESAVLQTVAYVDMYDYPLTVDEIHRYLIGVRSTLPEVENVLANGQKVAKNLQKRERYFSLAGRESIVETRKRRSRTASELWPQALSYGRLIAALPYARMVAVTGSLAVDNSDRHSDIDFLIVTQPGRLWMCRAMTILIVRFAARRSVPLCPNYFLTENALVFDERNLYAAHELVQMVPISGMKIYEQLRRENDWVNEFLPNAAGLPPQAKMVGPSTSFSHLRFFRRPAEAMLSLPPGDWLEQWEMERKIRKLSALSGDDESAFSANWCKGHFESHGRHAMTLFNENMGEIEKQGEEK